MKTNLHPFRLFLIACITALLCSFVRPPKSIYSIQLRDIDGGAVDLSKHRGKKMVIITLSGNEADSTLNQLSAFYAKYNDSAVVIGVLLLEDGYKEGKKTAVKKLFKEEKKLGIVLTGSMFTKKASAASQSELMHWLTHKEENLHFDSEVRGAGHKFFIDEAGVLYGVLGLQAPLSHPIIAKIMSKPRRPVPGQAAPVSNN
jgi:glutathione peroxidase-family protein